MYHSHKAAFTLSVFLELHWKTHVLLHNEMCFQFRLQCSTYLTASVKEIELIWINSYEATIIDLNYSTVYSLWDILSGALIIIVPLWQLYNQGSPNYTNAFVSHNITFANFIAILFHYAEIPQINNMKVIVKNSYLSLLKLN